MAHHLPTAVLIFVSHTIKITKK